MLKVENMQTFNWEGAIRGMRNPMNSWNKMDSEFGVYGVRIGPNDLDLMKRLRAGGPDDRKFLRQIFVSMDITAPEYWWPEMDQYKVATVTNSCSKMHKLLARPFLMSDFSFEHLTGYKNEIPQFRPAVTEDMALIEEWKTINDKYRVSNYGRVLSLAGKEPRYICGSINSDGYISVTINGKQCSLGRLVATFFCDKPDGKDEVNHKDGNKMNNFADNLEWVTHQENIDHSVANHFQSFVLKSGTQYKGKFTEDQRQEIKEKYEKGGISRRKLAEEYGVSHTCINDIINEKYKYVGTFNAYEELARPLADTLNELRDLYLKTSDHDEQKAIWYSILQLLPLSYNQKRTWTANYEVLVNIYHARKNHKLTEWHTFCEWIETLPYAKELITGDAE